MIQRATTLPDFADFSATTADDTSWSDSNVAANTTYHYRVRALNAGGVADWSNIAATTTPTMPVLLEPLADAHVRSGSYAATNYGAATTLEVRLATVNDARQAYLKFDLTGVSDISNAVLRVSASQSGTGTAVPTVLTAVADTAWDELTINWNNRPPLGGVLSSLTVTGGTAYRYYDYDITGHLRAERALGHDLISLALSNTATSTVQVRIQSREAAAATPTVRPQLIIYTNSLALVTITATANASEWGPQTGHFTIARDTATGDLLVPLSVTGTAIPATHYLALPASVTISNGQSSTDLPVVPVVDNLAQGTRTVIVTLANGSNDTVLVEDKPADAWRFQYFAGNPPGSADPDDPEGDGLINLLEYAFTTHPLASNDTAQLAVAGWTIPSTTRYLTLTYRQNTNVVDLTFVPEAAGALTNNAWNGGPVEISRVNRGDHEEVTVRDTVPVESVEKRFLRLRISR